MTIRPTPPGWFRAYTAAEAIALLSTGEFDEVSLDHDLGPGKYTGYSVAVWIEMHAHAGKLKRLKWNVHSANPPGRARIEAAMLSAERIWKDQEYQALPAAQRAEIAVSLVLPSQKGCEECGRVLQGIGYPYVCGQCLQKPPTVDK